MYSAFDKFLATGTWHTGHPLDDERFYTALATVVRNPDFNADALGDYMRSAKGVDRDDENHSGLSSAIDRRVTQADAVRDFLNLTEA